MKEELEKAKKEIWELVEKGKKELNEIINSNKPPSSPSNSSSTRQITIKSPRLQTLNVNELNATKSIDHITDTKNQRRKIFIWPPTPKEKK